MKTFFTNHCEIIDNQSIFQTEWKINNSPYYPQKHVEKIIQQAIMLNQKIDILNKQYMHFLYPLFFYKF